MECSECGVRGSEGYCVVCHKLLCEVCATRCAVCSTILCDRHRERTTGGRDLCPRCMTRRNEERAARLLARSKRNHGHHHAESLSFQALQAGTDEMPGANFRADPGGDVVSRLAQAAVDNEEINQRVLTASAHKTTPVWVSSLFLGGLCCVLLLLVVGRSGYQSLQPWMSYFIMFMSLLTAVWAVHGMRQDAPTKERRLCLIGLVLAIFACIVAIIFRSPGAPS